MYFEEFQEECRRTFNTSLTFNEALSNIGLGMAGETGETVEHIKKYLYHNKPLNYGDIRKELGDQLFYIAWACSVLGYNMSDVAQGNIDKLRQRWPNGFQK